MLRQAPTVVHPHRAARVKATVAVASAAAIFMLASDGRAAVETLEVTPKIGKPKTAFVAHFTARYPTSWGRGKPARFHYYEGRGPRGCRRFSLGEELTKTYAVGDSVRLRMTPDSIGSGKRRRWCPGNYTGRVFWYRITKRGVLVERRTMGRIAFTVER
jgi:hypothetical protein